MLFNAPQNDVFGFGDFYYRNDVPALWTIAGAIVKRSSRREVIQFIKRVQWTSAIRQFKGIGRFHRLVLTVVFLTAHTVKKSRIYSRGRASLGMKIK